MDTESKYVKNIKARSQFRFLIGALVRMKRFYKCKYINYIARKNGATIGKMVTMPLALAKLANSNLKVGNHTSIQTSKLDLRAPVTIGNNVIIGSNVEILTCSHDVDSPDWDYKTYGIIIEDFVWIATNSFVLPSCSKIDRGAVIGAGSVLSKNVEEMDIMIGNPASFLRKRKQVHYNLCVENLLGNDFKTYLKVRKNILD
jgi:acetyltransferase-like isoleucine patch superfamily enzyme